MCRLEGEIEEYLFSGSRRAAVNAGPLKKAYDMDDTRLKREIDEIVAKINKTMKKIESVVPLNAPEADASGDEKADSTPAGDNVPQEGSQSP